VGIYVDAKPGVAAVRMTVTTPTPGWEGSVYVTNSLPDAPATPAAAPEQDHTWQKVADLGVTKHTNEVDLDTAGHAFRYYLVWITKLPPDQEHAEISEIELFERAG